MIGIIGSMKKEIEYLLNNLEQSCISPKKFGMYTFYSGKLSDVDVVICACYPGKVNAATVASIMITEYEINSIINIGISGTHCLNKYPIGSILLGQSVKQYDVDTTAVGDPKNFISGCSKTIFYSELNMLDTLEQKYKLPLVSIATGDTFIDSDELRDIIDSDIIDMESGAIAQVCYCLNHTPFLIIKCISDSGNSEEYNKNKDQCCQKVQEFLIKSLEVLYMYK